VPSIERAYLGVAATAGPLPFFLEDPKRYWWLAIIIGLGSWLVIDDLLYHLGLPCILCKVLPE